MTLHDIVEQWLKDDPDMANYSLVFTNRPWLKCRCHEWSDTLPYCCTWLNCVQVITVSGRESFDLYPESPTFFDDLKRILLDRCKKATHF